MTIEQRYLADAKSHLALAAKHIKQGMNNDDRFQAVICAAVGVEKLLKYLIAKVNPALILKTMNFNNIVTAFHLERVATANGAAKIKKEADTDVITLFASIEHALYFCDGVKTHKGALHQLRSYRDLLVHRPSDEVEAGKCDVLLCRDLYTAINAISACADETAASLFGEEHARLAALSLETATAINLRQRMVALLEEHRLLWLANSEDPAAVALADQQTDYALERGGVNRTDCPACGNPAIETFELEFDWDWDEIENQPTQVVVGGYTTGIYCHYCGLSLTGYDEIEYVENMRGGGATP